MSILYVQSPTNYLAGSGVVVGATSVVLTVMNDIYGNVLAMADFGSKGFGTLEPDTSNEESFTFTGLTVNANGTVTLSGVKTILAKSPYTETSGLVRAHVGGSKMVVTDSSGFWATFANKNNDETITGRWGSATVPSANNDYANKAYVDGLVIAGAPNASSTVKGITKLSLDPVSPTIPIAVGDNDTRVPTAGQAAALPGSDGTPGSGNKYLTQQAFASGIMLMYAGSSAPTGWLLCDGTSYLQATYANLFTAIGTTYGSADGSHFNVPDMRGRAPIGVGAGTGGGASGTGLPTGGSALTARARGDWLGEQTHVLTVAELASHTHSYPNNAGNSGGSGPTPATSGGAGASSPSNTGSDTAHNTMQPVMTVNFIIKT